MIPEANHQDPPSLFELCAADPELYGRTFFPKTFRQSSPEFHLDYWAKIEDPNFDFFAAEVFRGGAKTALARVAISRRIAYGISRSILNICVSESMALHTARWLMKQVEHNTKWASTYQLRKGKNWATDFFEIEHGIEGVTIAVVSKGMTSGLRGMNIDDFRPDFVYCDDIQNEENTKSEETLKSTNELIFGGVIPSMAPKSEAPLRKFVLTQTAIKKGDVIALCHVDPTFRTVKYPKILVDKLTGEQRSAWPERWSLEECLAEKATYVKKNMLYVWLREYGCKVVGSSDCAFKTEWLKYWTVLPIGMTVYISIDPARSKRAKAHKQAIVVLGVHHQDYYVLETFAQRGQNPEETWVELARMVRKWHPHRVGVESIAYQQVLAWYIRKRMVEESFWFSVVEIEDRRSKDNRISQAIAGIASNGRLIFHKDDTELQAEYEEWAPGIDIDRLDALAMGISMANPWMLAQASGQLVDEDGAQTDLIKIQERAYPDLKYRLGAP